MNRLELLAGVGFALLGGAYLFVPSSVYHFDPFGFSRDTQSEPSAPSDTILWLYRFIGGWFVVMSVSYLL